MTTNPFTFGNPIRDPKRFYGRKKEVSQIINRLKSSAHESTSIVGERRIGKTSLLNYLSNPDVAKGLGLSDDYCLLYIDFQGLTDITPQRFWQWVLEQLSLTIRSKALIRDIESLTNQEKFDLFDLKDLFKKVNGKGLIVVLFMDEFEYVTQNTRFNIDFYGGLRALAIHHDLALVTATRRELIDLCHSEEIKGSPFFNIFANVVLRSFPQGEVDEFIEGNVGGTESYFTPEEKELVARLGGGHPFFMQIAGFYLFEEKSLSPDSDLPLENVVSNFDQQAAPHFSYLWSHSSESEKITLLATMALNQQKPSKKTLPNLDNLVKHHPLAQLDVSALAMRGLMNETNGLYSLFSPRFEYWISREVIAIPGKEETPTSVDNWFKSGGREEFEPVRGFLPKFKKKYWSVISVLMKEMSFEIAGAAIFEILRNILI